MFGERHVGPDRKADPEGGAAAGAGIDAHPAAMPLGDLAHGGEAEARALLLAGARAQAAAVEVEDPLAVLLRHARPLVPNADLHQAAAAAGDHLDRHPRLGAAVAQGVLDQVLQRLAQQHLVGAHHRQGTHHDQPGAGALQPAGERLRHRVGDPFDLHPVEPRLPRPGAAEAQDPLDQLRHGVDVARDPLGGGARLLQVALVEMAVEPAGEAADRDQRALEIVGDDVEQPLHVAGARFELGVVEGQRLGEARLLRPEAAGLGQASGALALAHVPQERGPQQQRPAERGGGDHGDAPARPPGGGRAEPAVLDLGEAAAGLHRLDRLVEAAGEARQAAVDGDGHRGDPQPGADAGETALLVEREDAAVEGLLQQDDRVDLAVGELLHQRQEAHDRERRRPRQRLGEAAPEAAGLVADAGAAEIARGPRLGQTLGVGGGGEEAAAHLHQGAGVVDDVAPLGGHAERRDRLHPAVAQRLHRLPGAGEGAEHRAQAGVAGGLDQHLGPEAAGRPVLGRDHVGGKREPADHHLRRRRRLRGARGRVASRRAGGQRQQQGQRQRRRQRRPKGRGARTTGADRRAADPPGSVGRGPSERDAGHVGSFDAVGDGRPPEPQGGPPKIENP